MALGDGEMCLLKERGNEMGENDEALELVYQMFCVHPAKKNYQASETIWVVCGAESFADLCKWKKLE